MYEGDVVSSANFMMCFPGQGSQRVGMLGEMASSDPSIQRCYEEASDVLGVDLWGLVSNGPADVLQLTENAQPALLVAGVSLWRRWRANGGPVPNFMSGHSLGECTALVCSEAISFADGVSLVRERGRLMQAATPPGEGVMYAVLGLDAEKIEEICRAHCREDNIVELVNYNAPGQMVIAGHTEVTGQASQACVDAGAKRSIALPVSAPFHTQLMRAMSDSFATTLSAITLSAPSVPIVHNANALPEPEPERIKELLIAQLYSPVRWIDCVRYCVDQGGVACTVECGPGKVLSGLNKRIDKTLSCYNLEPDELFEDAMDAVSALC